MNEIYASWSSPNTIYAINLTKFLFLSSRIRSTHTALYWNSHVSFISLLPFYQTHSLEGHWAPGQVLFCFVFFFHMFRKDHVKYLLSSIFLIIITLFFVSTTVRFLLSLAYSVA